jgi:16S rRNA (guanine(527)-N(7))-methyltransferase RsmG
MIFLVTFIFSVLQQVAPFHIQSVARFKYCLFDSHENDIDACRIAPNGDLRAEFPSITSEQWDQLNSLCSLYIEWNSKVNLISRKDIGNLVSNHLAPCLGIHKVKQFQRGERVIDVGTGGGLPGIPLAIVNPHATFTLLDSNSKKMMVVEDIVNRLGLHNVRVRRSRAEDLSPEESRYDFMLGRAVSAIPTFLGFASHLIDPNSSFRDDYQDLDFGEEKSGSNNGHVSLEDSSEADSTRGMPDFGSGLLYLKGGDFKDELASAQIDMSSCRQSPIATLVPQLPQSDKVVLYVKAKEIVAFASRAATTGTCSQSQGRAAEKKRSARNSSRRRPRAKNI